MRLLKKLALASVLAMGLAGTGAAQEDYPNRPITMIVPFPPGGVADTVARPVADAMGRYLGQPVVIENRSGAGGGIGMAAAARAKPDGYTILMALSSISIIPVADEILGRSPMYKLDQFIPIGRITADPTVLVVPADSPWKTAQEFFEAARSGNKEIYYGSSGNYGTMHVPMEMLRAAADLKNLQHVPFSGAGPAVIALLGGQVQALSTGPASIVQHIKAGKVRALAHWGDGRLEALPDVPSLKELGLPVTFAQWSGVFVPAGTPEPIVQKLREAVNAAAHDPKVREIIQGAGSPILYQDAPEFREYWLTDAAQLEKAVRTIGKVE